MTDSRRLWPPPARGWSVAMKWHDLLFAHWPVDAEKLRPLVPERLEIDTFDGQAWLGVVPFRMTGIRARRCPPVPWLSAFSELNVRTYVSVDDKPGVWFFSLDAANPVAVWKARRSFHLPYFNARMTLEYGDHELVRYTSERTHRGAPPAELLANYRPTGPVYRSQRGSLDEWLTERYCLYSADRRGRIFRGEILHEPWLLQAAEAEVQMNSMATPLGIELTEPATTLHFARRLDVVAWKLAPV